MIAEPNSATHHAHHSCTAVKERYYDSLIISLHFPEFKCFFA